MTKQRIIQVSSGGKNRGACCPIDAPTVLYTGSRISRACAPTTVVTKVRDNGCGNRQRFACPAPTARICVPEVCVPDNECAPTTKIIYGGGANCGKNAKCKDTCSLFARFEKLYRRAVNELYDRSAQQLYNIENVDGFNSDQEVAQLNELRDGMLEQIKEYPFTDTRALYHVLDGIECAVDEALCNLCDFLESVNKIQPVNHNVDDSLEASCAVAQITRNFSILEDISLGPIYRYYVQKAAVCQCLFPPSIHYRRRGVRDGDDYDGDDCLDCGDKVHHNKECNGNSSSSSSDDDDSECYNDRKKKKKKRCRRSKNKCHRKCNTKCIPNCNIDIADACTLNKLGVLASGSYVQLEHVKMSLIQADLAPVAADKLNMYISALGNGVILNNLADFWDTLVSENDAANQNAWNFYVAGLQDQFSAVCNILRQPSDQISTPEAERVITFFSGLPGIQPIINDSITNIQASAYPFPEIIDQDAESQQQQYHTSNKYHDAENNIKSSSHHSSSKKQSKK